MIKFDAKVKVLSIEKKTLKTSSGNDFSFTEVVVIDLDEKRPTKMTTRLGSFVEPDEKCEGCTKGKVYCMDTKRPTGFESVVKNHGILAYQRDETDYSNTLL